MNSLGNHGAFSHGIKFRHQLRGKPATLLRVEITDLLGTGQGWIFTPVGPAHLDILGKNQISPKLNLNCPS